MRVDEGADRVDTAGRLGGMIFHHVARLGFPQQVAMSFCHTGVASEPALVSEWQL